MFAGSGLIAKSMHSEARLPKFHFSPIMVKPTLPHIICVTLSKLLHSLCFSFIICDIGVTKIVNGVDERLS